MEGWTIEDVCTFVQGLSQEFGDHESVYAAAMKEKAISKPLLSPNFQPRHVRSVPSQVIACAGMPRASYPPGGHFEHDRDTAYYKRPTNNRQGGTLPRTVPHTVIVILTYLREYFEYRDKQYSI